MDKDLLQYLINLSVVIPIFIVLIILSLKLGKVSLNKMQGSRYTQVIERTNLSKDTNMFVIKTGSEGCVVLVSQNHTQKIRDLSSKEMSELLKSKEKLRVDSRQNKETLNRAISAININHWIKKSDMRKLKYGNDK